MSGNIYRALLGWMNNNNTQVLYFVVFEIKEMTLGHGLDGSGHATLLHVQNTRRWLTMYD
jgi:hypothetical protein